MSFHRPIRSRRVSSNPSLTKAVVETLESRQLLSVSASTLIGPISMVGSTRSYEVVSSGSVVASSVGTVVGPATFNGVSAIETDTASNESGGVVNTALKNYADLTSAGYLSYGGTSIVDESGTIVDETTTYSPPLVLLPPTLVAGTPYNESTTSTSIQTGGASSTIVTDESQTLTLEAAQQSITVPAGTFPTCYVVDVSTTTTSTTTISGQNPITSGPTTTTGMEYYATGVGLVDDVFSNGASELTAYAGTGGGGGGGGGTTASQVVFGTPPIGTSAMATLTPVVVFLEDSTGTLVTSDTSNVTVSLVGGPGTLTGTTTVKAAAGVAAYLNLAVTAPGTYTLVASDGTDTPTTSAPFTISASSIKSIGDLDPTFGTGGIASHNVGFTSTNGVAADGTQSVLIGPIGTSPAESFGVTRYNSDGSVDTNFGSSGVVTTPFGTTDAVPTAVDVLPGGGILVAGTATTFTSGVASGSQFAIAEYNADGSLNSGFGTGGQMLFSLSNAGLTNDVLNAMTVAANGTIYLAGSSNAAGAGNNDLAIFSLTSTGAPNPGFGTGGIVLTDVAAGDDSVNSLVVQKNGDLVAAGSATVGGIVEIALARYLPTGKLDAHFGIKGIATSNIGGVYDSASSVALQINGEIIVGGLTASGTGDSLYSNFAVQRYTAAGKLDRTFGGGTVVTNFGQPSAVTQLIVQGNGNIVASGKITASLATVTPDALDLAVARITTKGVLDTSFNNSGKVIIDLAQGVVTTAGEHTVSTAALLTTAADLGTQFDQFTHAEQGVVTVTTGGELLDAGNNGSNTVEAELVSAGVDLLTQLLSTLPSSVLGGAKGTATVKIVNHGTQLAKGTVTIELSVVDAQSGSSTAVHSFTEAINTAAGKFKQFHLAFVYPAGINASQYYLQATAQPGSTISVLNPADATTLSTATVNISPPTITLAGSSLAAIGALVTGKPAKFSIDITNGGNVTAVGSIVIILELSPNPDGSAPASIGTVNLHLGQRANTSHVYKLSLKSTGSLSTGAQYLVAIVDPTLSLGSIDATNNTAIDPTVLTLG